MFVLTVETIFKLCLKDEMYNLLIAFSFSAIAYLKITPLLFLFIRKRVAALLCIYDSKENIRIYTHIYIYEQKVI